MPVLEKGCYTARFASNDTDIQAAQALRALLFLPDKIDPGTAMRDQDEFDSICRHVLIEDCTTQQLVCCFRFLPLLDGMEIERSYSAQFYELSALKRFSGKMVEMGRFCVHPEKSDPDILRIAWGAVTRYVDENKVKMLFGCSSFQGMDAGMYLDAFALLKTHHLAPHRWSPKVKAPSVYRFAQRLRHQPDAARVTICMPPLLRTYLMMGGWVSDHAVIDRDLNTLHVFTGLEIAQIPAARKRLLRMVAY